MGRTAQSGFIKAVLVATPSKGRNGIVRNIYLSNFYGHEHYEVNEIQLCIVDMQQFAAVLLF